MEKGTTVGQIYEATRKLKDAGIRVGFFLQYGYPGELEDDINRTLQMVRDCRPEEIGISVSYPLPGTKFYERVEQQLSEKHNWYESQDLDVMFHGTYVPDYYRALHKVTHKKLRVWQGMEMLKQVASHPLRIDRRGARRIAATAFHFFTLPWFQTRLHLLAQKPNGRPVTPSTAYPDDRAVVPPEY
jgi:anaerobic magnesium-protoporphyrin IX monomethyl ester cyclase